MASVKNQYSKAVSNQDGRFFVLFSRDFIDSFVPTRGTFDAMDMFLKLKQTENYLSQLISQN